MTETVFLNDSSSDELDREVSEQVCRELLDKSSRATHITLYINSSGGSVTHAQAIVDVIRQLTPRCHVTGVVLGNCCSAAVWVLQACDWRKCGRSAHLMLHEPNYGVSDVTLETLEAYARSCRIERRELYRALLDRIQDVVPEYTMSRLTRWLKTDRYLTAEEALEWGLIDQVG